MPTTEAGKALDERLWTDWNEGRMADAFALDAYKKAIAAIEAEARIDGRASGVAAERARIRAAVEGLRSPLLDRAAVLRIIDREDA